MASIKLKNIYKIYPHWRNPDEELVAVSDFNLDIKDGEVIVFVGPSGCGKTSTLRMIAGLEEITRGELYIDDILVNNVEPKDRGIAMVFQNYALFPYMTVYENIAFGLKPFKISDGEVKAKVEEIARIFDISHLFEYKKRQLSSGQQQRVALARALVGNHKIILLDEPLSNLDAWLRVFMRIELMKIHKKFNATYIYVTHDQNTAMTIADRIVVMKDGVIQQVGTPEELNKHPRNLFVAGFMGAPRMNFWNTEADGREVIAGVRPGDIYIDETGDIDANISVREFTGDRIYLYCEREPDKQQLTVCVSPDCTAKSGDKIKLAVNPDKIYLFDKDTEETIIN